ncbi:hypothetical protein D3C71_690080 [compost metagenome]
MTDWLARICFRAAISSMVLLCQSQRSSAVADLRLSPEEATCRLQSLRFNVKVSAWIGIRTPSRIPQDRSGLLKPALLDRARGALRPTAVLSLP